MKVSSTPDVWFYESTEQASEDCSCGTLGALVLSLKNDLSPFLSYYEGELLSGRYSFHEFFMHSRSLAAQLRTLLGPSSQGQDRVGISMSNSSDLLAVYAACFLLNLTIVPINPNESPIYIEQILSHAGCRLLLASNPLQTNTCPSISMKALAAFPSGVDDLALDEEIKANSLIDSQSIAAVFYTSGTTSSPKGVMLSHRALIANLSGLKQAHKLGRASIHYCVLPLYHVNAFGFSFLTILFAKAQLILSDRFRAEYFWRILIAERCETSNLVPEIVSQLTTKTHVEALDPIALKHVKYFVSAASALSRDLLVRFWNKFSIRIFQGYGLSETVNFSLLVSPFIDEQEYQEVMLNLGRPSVGTPIYGNDVDVKSLSDDSHCAEGEIGELVVRGWNVMSSYLDNKQATDIAFRGGWFHTGDLGFFSWLYGKKYFVISGRLKEVVKRNSETIYVQEIEEALQTIEGCLLSAVTGFANNWTGEELAAVVVKNELTPSIEKMLAVMRSKVGFAKAPKIVQFVSEIPRTGSMKVKRRDLSLLFGNYISTKFTE